MADIEFSSISSFLQRVEIEAELKQKSTSAIFSFRVPRGGIQRLIASKESLLRDLVENNRKLSAWVGEHGESLGPLELIVLRSMYVTNKNSIELVHNHVLKAQSLRNMYRSAEQLPFDAEEDNIDAPPF
jgi:hypothetical protein